MSTLTTASAVEDYVLDVTKAAEDLVIRTARTITDELQPLTKSWLERPSTPFGPAPREILDHTFGFVDRVVANLREFSSQLVVLLPDQAEAHPTSVKTASKAHAA
jgi:hypothetical protein